MCLIAAKPRALEDFKQLGASSVPPRTKSFIHAILFLVLAGEDSLAYSYMQGALQ